MKIEFYNYWKHYDGFELIRIAWQTEIFTEYNALQIWICNFELRIYIPK